MLRAKLAVRLALALTTSVQLPVPAQPAPLQPEKVEPAAGVALRAKLVPLAMLTLHVLPQSMPLGLDTTVPLPAPALLAVTV